MKKILIVDDERSMREMLSILFKKEDYDVVTAANAEEALKLLSNEIFDLVLSDMKMPKGSGMDVLKAVKELSNETMVVMMTAYASTETAIEAMKSGAYDYIIKPFKVDELKIIVKNALEKRKLKEENQLLKKELQGLTAHTTIVGKSEAIKKVFDIIERVANSKSTIMIFGETGTGKELVARAIHFKSDRKDAPFVTINCGALPETLLESELFGYMKGAYTGAHANKEGLFEVANGGTIFLDEVGEMPLSTQVKLLRVLQEKELRRLGGVQNIKVDVRVLAATNRVLEDAVAEGIFREDLYYRLSVIPVHLPPLRERHEDIPMIAEYFLQKYTKISGKPAMTIAEDAMKLLTENEWRGNVRELENTMERLVALCNKKTITSREINECVRRIVPQKTDINGEVPPEGFDLEGYIEDIERRYLVSAIDKADGSKKKAADLLKMNFRSFRYKLDKYGIKNKNGN